MNAQIRELELEAIAYADSKVPANDRYNDIYHSIVRGKFAELIVRECARPLILLGREMDKDAEFYKYHSKEVIATHMYIRLEKHFGVE